MSRIANDRGKVSDFVKAGTMELSGSRKSLKIVIDDPQHVFEETYYVSIGDIQTILREPNKVAVIVKRIDRESKIGIGEGSV